MRNLINIVLMVGMSVFATFAQATSCGVKGGGEWSVESALRSAENLSVVRITAVRESERRDMYVHIATVELVEQLVGSGANPQTLIGNPGESIGYFHVGEYYLVSGKQKEVWPSYCRGDGPLASPWNYQEKVESIRALLNDQTHK